MANKLFKVTFCVYMLAAGVVSSSNASILTFDGIGATSAIPIPDDYGDRINSTIDPITSYEYGIGNGFTPNITVSYFPDPIASSGNSFSLWPSGYGDLTNALGHSSFNVPGEVVLTPDLGNHVILNSFDIAGWSSSTYIDQQIRVLNESGIVLFDSGLIDVNTAFPSSHLTFTFAPIVSAEALHIEISDVGNLGLDNVNFDQAVVPIPAAAWLFGSGLIGLIGIARRRKS